MVGNFQSMQSLNLLRFALNTGLSVTPFMGHLGSLASRWSVPVLAPVLLVLYQMYALSGNTMYRKAAKLKLCLVIIMK